MKGQKSLILFLVLLLCSGSTNSTSVKKREPLSVIQKRADYYRNNFKINLDMVQRRLEIPDTIKYITTL